MTRWLTSVDMALFVSLAVVAAELVLFVRLIYFRLHHILPALCFYLLFDAISTTIIWIFGRAITTATYQVLWIIITSIDTVLLLTLIIELYKLFYKTYPGIDVFAQTVLRISLTLAFIAACVTLIFDVPSIALPQYQAVRRIFVGFQFTSALLGLVAILTTSVLPKAPERKTVFIYGSVLSILLLSNAVQLLVFNFIPKKENNIGIPITYQLVQLICYVIWIVKLRPQNFPALRELTREELTELHTLAANLEELRSIARWLLTGRSHRHQ